MALDSIKNTKNIKQVKSFQDPNGKLNASKTGTNNEQINANNNFFSSAQKLFFFILSILLFKL